MKSTEVLQNIKHVFKRFLGDATFPEISEIKEPTIKDVFDVCCGPRLFSNALKLHGEYLSGVSPGDFSEGKNQTRP